MSLSQADRSGPVLTVLNHVHVRQVQQAFSSRGATVDGGPWPPWSDKYAAWRRRHRRLGKRMMRLTHSLWEKSTHVSHPGYVGVWLGNLRYGFGFRDDVGFFHEHGVGPLPVRSLVRKTAAQHEKFVTAFVRFYRSRIRQVSGAVR
jgi:hypothetical protein